MIPRPPREGVQQEQGDGDRPDDGKTIAQRNQELAEAILERKRQRELREKGAAGTGLEPGQIQQGA